MCDAYSGVVCDLMGSATNELQPGEAAWLLNPERPRHKFFKDARPHRVLREVGKNCYDVQDVETRKIRQFP